MILRILLLLFLFPLSSVFAQNCEDIDFSHLQTTYDLQCLSTPTLELIAVPSGELPQAIAWTHDGALISTQNIFTITEIGNYVLTIVQDENCTAAFNFTVRNEGLGILASNIVVSGCISSFMDTTFCVEFWHPSYNYIWPSGDTSPCVTGLIMGETYAVTVTNDVGCVEVINLEAPVLQGVIGDIEILEGESCDRDRVVVTIGGENFRYPCQVVFRNNLNQHPRTFIMSNPGPDTFLLRGGSYSMDIFTEDGCFAEPIAFDLEGVSIFFSIDPEPDCHLESLDLAVNVTGGPLPFTYDWGAGPTTESVLSVSSPGFYYVTVTNAAGCAVADSFFVEEWSNGGMVNVFETVHPSCGNSDGALAANIVFGLSNSHTYLWSTGSTEQMIENLAAGEYTVTVTDGNGCTAVFSETLFDTISHSSFEINYENENCGGESALLVPNPFNPDLTYSWIGPGFNGVVADSITATASGLYTLFVMGPNNCSGNLTRQVPLFPALTAELSAEPIECESFSIIRANYSRIIQIEDVTHEWILPDNSIVTTSNNRFLASQPGLYIYQGTHETTNCFMTDTIFLATMGTSCNNVTGTLWADEGNCQLDGTEIRVPRWFVNIRSVDGSYDVNMITNSNGDFNVTLVAGDYLAEARPYNEELYTTCPSPQAFTVSPDGTGHVDVLMPYVEECPQMYVNVTAPFIRRCFENNAYVHYCNDGSVTAENAQVTVELDPFLVYVSSDITPSSITAHTLTFDVGDLAPYECGRINLRLLASCDAELGQTHCLEATATPNAPCPSPNNWNGANLTLSAACDGNELEFFITNDGNAPTTGPLRYIVIQDGVMLMGGPIDGPVLAAGEVYTIPAFEADGSTYYVQTNQEPGNPGFSSPTLIIEGCGVNDQGSFTMGLVNQLPFGDADVPWFDVFCRNNIGAYDPNEKVGLPLGIAAPHYIEEGTTLSYDIQFQNTGTDTAFTVVIRDTIAENFDLTSLRVGASSHPYTYTLDENRVLTITFDNILLPDSSVNLTASQGVVSYAIDHVAGLPLNTELRNQAGIYFDYNVPIYTSTTLHTIGKDFISSLIPRGNINQLAMEVFPNPGLSNSDITFSLPVEAPYKLDIYDNTGRLIYSKESMTATTTINPGRRPAGCYIARAMAIDGSFIALKRFILE